MGTLDDSGFRLARIELPASVREEVERRNWVGLDRAIRRETLAGGAIFAELRKDAEFSEIEFILSIRSSLEFPDEDGIWHDDGSRRLAFSLSLTLDPSAITGGRLEIRRRFVPGAATASLATPPFGTVIVFATGQQGYEHRILRVAAGERIIAAGWCT